MIENPPSRLVCFCSLLLTFVFVVSQIAPASAARNSTSAVPRRAQSSSEKTFSISVDKGLVGKAYEVRITSPGCVEASGDLADAELYAPVGSGVTIETKKTAPCSLTALITVDGSAPPGTIQLWVQKKNGGAILGAVNFTIGNMPAPGPIPPGLTPQVDVMWSVIPEKIVGQNFGRTIEKNYYCVELVIGNNTGYSLQIVSVGFEVPLSDADLIAAAGKTSNGANIGTGPHKRPPPQNKTGDKDYGGRGNGDSQLPISANTRFVKLPNSSYRLTRGSLESRHLLYPRTLVLSTITALGPIFTGFTPYFHNVNHRGNFTEAINIFSNPLEKGLELVWPDPRDAQRNRFDDQILRDGMILANNLTTRSMVFFPKTLLRPYLDVTAVELLCRERGSGTDFTECKRSIQREFDATYSAWKNNPRAVMDRLGKLILVGDVIEATNRITVTSGPVPGPLAAQPTVFAASFKGQALAEITQGDSGTLELLGAHLTGAHVDPTSDKVSTVSVTSDSSGGSSSTTLKVAADAEPGEYTLMVVTSGGSLPLRFKVVHKDKPADLQLKYESGGTASTTVPSLKQNEDGIIKLNITGKNLKGANITVAAPSAGALFTHVDSNVSDTQLIATITVKPGTPAGKYSLRITNTGQKFEDLEFEVKYK